ncbi:hypothetical protein B5X24_HaOG214531 [Helicoverpa armigera]|uniref:Uncharacterized protein n=1 Tax=Helicoverpa armigera TaxID=29058 RepID=A0A2W1B963_HELAM|nr:hypothetical protein B5X24_HaOG214531 [Helicoverpa armigera]
MVCGLCQHNVYKTFLSVCHMKMFVCAHPEEELKLVSRYPCVLSAPYLSDQGMEAKGRKVEENDDDKVLRFIICRDRNKLGEIVADDPNCSFPEETHLKVDFQYDFKGIYMPMDSQMVSNEELKKQY